MVKNPLSNAGDACSLPGQEDPLEKQMTTHYSTLPWEIPGTEEAGGLYIVHWGAKESDMTEHALMFVKFSVLLCMHTCMYT